MKKINYYKLLIIPVLILIALLSSFCTPRESQVDSQEVAEEKNKEKFTTKETKQDAKFVTDAVAFSLAEVRLAELALSKSRDEEIKRIASHLKNDHAMLLADLTTYSAEHVITVPLTEPEDVRKRILKLENETDQFNKKWCDEVLGLHKEAIESLEKGNEKISNPELQEWITSTLPRLRKNFDLVSACNNRIK
jgi:predicted outer membrane protein